MQATIGIGNPVIKGESHDLVAWHATAATQSSEWSTSQFSSQDCYRISAVEETAYRDNGNDRSMPA
jgi:hypothetical protein